jgi:hypothetical protein
MDNGHDGEDVSNGERTIEQNARCIGQEHDQLAIPAIDKSASL